MSDILEGKRQKAGDAGYHWLCTAVRMKPNVAFVTNSVYLTNSSKKFRTELNFQKLIAVDALAKAYPTVPQ
jgi:hypothetical protein